MSSVCENSAPPIREKIDLLLYRIENLQSKGDHIYPPGLFPSQRYHVYLPYRREDSNVFFTALILFTLQGLSPYCTEAQREIITDITKKAIKCYPLYRSRKGRLTYNFWQNKACRQFPHGFLLHKLKFLELPDDIDDTALVYLTMPHDREDALWLKKELEKHANRSKKVIRNTFPKYRDLRAYSTWFGKNMYIEFDFCALCNLLYCLSYYKIPFNQFDEDTITYLRSVILSNEHIHHPFRVAPSYPRTALILYHISRLVAAFELPKLSELRPEIIVHLKKYLSLDCAPLDKVLLATSLARLGGNCPDIKYPFPILHKNYYFFNGGLLTAFENPLARWLAPHNSFHMKHTCEAYYLALVLEYEVLKTTTKGRY